MKKYSSYFNKRYFPEPDENGEQEEALPLDAVSEPGGLEAAASAADAFSAEMELPDVADFSTDSVPRATNDNQYYDASGYSALETPVANDYLSSSYTTTPYTSTPVESEASPFSSAVPADYSASAVASSGASFTNTAVDPEVTVISKSAIINGELTVSGDIRIFGKIKGNLTAQGNVEVAGKVIGNVTGNDIELNRCEIKGDINSTGFVFMDKESIMIGNVASHDITLDGKVKGDVAAVNKVYVRSNAVIVGNVHAATIAIDEGAALQGQVVIASKESATLNISEDGLGSK